MKADRNDAPRVHQNEPPPERCQCMDHPGVVGTCVTLELLQVAGSAFLGGTFQSLAKSTQAAKTSPAAQITRQDSVSENWERILGEQNRRDQTAQMYTTTHLTGATSETVKQTVFNDNDHIPRSPDNVVNFMVATSLDEEKPAEKMKSTRIKQESSIKDRACWPHKEGSLERRVLDHALSCTIDALIKKLCL